MSQSLLLKILGLEKLSWEEKNCKNCGQVFLAKKNYWVYCYECAKNKFESAAKGQNQKLMKISTFSLLAHCQRCFLTDYFGLRKETFAMKEGTRLHEKFEKGKEISQEDLIANLQKGIPNIFSKISVIDYKNRLKGILDRLQVIGRDRKKTVAKIIELKTFNGNPKILPYHLLQLSSYALAMSNDERFKRILNIIGGSVVLQDRKNERIVTELEIGSRKLDNFTKPIPKLLKVADKIVNEKVKPKEKFFDIESRKWKEIDDNRWHKCDLLNLV